MQRNVKKNNSNIIVLSVVVVVVVVVAVVVVVVVVLIIFVIIRMVIILLPSHVSVLYQHDRRVGTGPWQEVGRQGLQARKKWFGAFFGGL